MANFRNVLVGVSLLVLVLGACGGPEHATVDQFFRAARDNDSPTVASMSAVGPPGEIESWEVVEVNSRTTEPFALPEISKRLAEAKAERDEVLEEGRKYMEEEVDALDRILPKIKDDPEYQFSGRLGEVQKEWLDLIERRREKERVYQQVRRENTEESGIASKSVMRQIPVAELEGQVQVTELLMNLTPKDQTTALPFNVTLKKYDVSEPGSDRIEQARWVIANIEGANDEARAHHDAIRSAGPLARAAAENQSGEDAPSAPAATAASETPESSGETVARAMSSYVPKELRGLARVQILSPETKIEGNDVVSVVRVRNASKDWITRFTATEYWYDDQGTATRGGSETHEGRFMPGDVIELELRTRKNDSFFQNQFEFSHANGEVNATVVQGFPESD